MDKQGEMLKFLNSKHDDRVSLQFILAFRTFRYKCTRSQLNNKGRGELHEISRVKVEIGKEII